MKKLAILIAACAASTAAHTAELLVPKGSKAEIRVEYVFTSEGKYASPSKNGKRNWKVRRQVTMTAQYAADAPQHFGMLHAKDPQQHQDLKSMESLANSAVAKAQPTMGDMMRIVEECGGPDATGAEECISKKVSNYGNTRKDTMLPQMKSAQKDAESALAVASGNRFQLWQMKSFAGSYDVDEHIFEQTYEMTCTETKKCVRDTTRKGGGDIRPPKGRSVGGASMFEIDGAKKDVIVQLPVPLELLTVKQVIVTSFPNDKNSSGDAGMSPWMMPATKPMTISIPSNLESASGSKTFKIEGLYERGGLLTVNWRFTQR